MGLAPAAMITRRDILGWLGLSFMAGNDAGHPFQEDFLQTIKEVHWGEAQNFLVGSSTPLFGSGAALLLKSIDGKTFTEIPGISNDITAIAYTGGVWALSSKHSIYISKDLASWQVAFSSSGSRDIRIAAGKPKGAKKGIFVGVLNGTSGPDANLGPGAAQFIMSSDLGKTWTTTSSKPGVFIEGIDFENGLFFASGGHVDVAIIGQTFYNRAPQGGLILTSSDGTRWASTSVGSSVFLTGITDVEFACPVVFGVAYNSKTKTYCAVANEPFGYASTSGLQGISAHLAFYTSTDGRRWGSGGIISNATSVLAGGFRNYGCRCIAYGNGTFVALGHELLFSGDTFFAGDAFTFTSGGGGAWGQERLNLGQDPLASLRAAPGGVNYSASAKQFVVCGTGFRIDDSGTSSIFHSPTGKGWITAYQAASGFGSVRLFTAVGVGKIPKK